MVGNTSSGLTVSSSNSSATAYKVFQENDAIDSADCWMSADTLISENAPRWISFTNTQAVKFAGVELVARHSNNADICRFPPKVKLWVSEADGTGKKALNNDFVELSDPGPDGIQYVKADTDITLMALSRIYLEIYGTHGWSYRNLVYPRGRVTWHPRSKN